MKKEKSRQNRFRCVMVPLIICCLFGILCGCSSGKTSADTSASVENSGQQTAKEWDKMSVTGTISLKYATQFQIDCYDDYRLITMATGEKYLVVPENQAVPSNLPEDIVVLQQPLDHIYLVATSAMDLFRALDSMDSIRLTGTEASGWYIPEAKQAMEEKKILYAGKYSAPDYELIVSEGCDLAIESTMIYHSPDIQEQLEKVGVPVFVERSSYESDPLGRMEWIKVYGTLMGKEEEAAAWFDQEVAGLSDILQQDNTGKTVGFFYITSNGAANIHKPGDYITKMIEFAGGKYAISSVEADENAMSTMNMQMENFYLEAQDADILIYNSTIDGELDSMSQLLDKSELLGEFKAVKNGTVWCTNKNMFQESTGVGKMIQDIHKILTDENVSDSELTYLHRLK